MEETGKTENHLSSAAAFVEGGIQDACDDACSICLEAFCKSDPSTVTSCKHEFHLQCVLEWCQRSSQCPMCWQPISLMDLTSQELFESVEQERNARANNARTATIFHHPAFGDFDLRDLAVGRSDAEIEERFFQQLAAAASIGRAHYISRREGRSRSGSHGHPQYLVCSPNSNTSGVSVPATAPRADNEPVHSIIASEPLVSATTPERELSGVTNVSPDQATQIASSTSGASNTYSRPSISTTGTSAGQSSPVSQDGPGPSDLQSLSESLKSRLNAVSMKYKESISKSTQGWRERLFSRNNSVADIGSEVRREITAGIASVKSRMMERLEKRENRSFSPASPSSPMHSPTDPNNDVVANHAFAHTNGRTTNDGFISNHTNTHPKNIPTSSWVVTSDPN